MNVESKRLRQRAKKLYEDVKQIRQDAEKLEKLRKESMKRHVEFEKNFKNIFQKYFEKEENKNDKPAKEHSTSFGLIPQMPQKLSKSEVCIIAVLPKFGHQAEPRRISMPHQLYVEKLNELLEEGEVFIYPASKSYTVKQDGKRVWIE